MSDDALGFMLTQQRQRIEQLERELSEARAERDRLRQHGNELSRMHGEMFKIACELFQMQRNGEQLAAHGLSTYDRLIYGPGRKVPPHATGPTQNTQEPKT